MRAGLAHRGRVIAGAVAALGLFALVSTLRPPPPLPSIDEGALLIEYVMPPGTWP